MPQLGQKKKERKKENPQKPITKLQSSKQCGTGIKTDIETKNMERILPYVLFFFSFFTAICIFDRSAKIIPLEKDTLFSAWCWGNWISTRERIKLGPYLITPEAKITVVPLIYGGCVPRPPVDA